MSGATTRCRAYPPTPWCAILARMLNACRWLGAWCVSLTLLAAAVPASGQELSEPTEAQFKLYEEGADAFQAGDYRKAVDLFEASLHLGKLNITYLNLGRSHFKLGECPEAARAYELARTAPAIAQPSPSAVRARVDQYVEDLATCPGLVTVRCAVPDELEEKLLIFVGDSGPHPCGAPPVSMAPGEVVVRATGGPKPLSKTVTVVAMEDVQVVFQADRASAEVKKSPIKPKGTIRRREGKVVLSQGGSDPTGLLLTVSVGTTVAGAFEDQVDGTALGADTTGSSSFTEASGFVIGGSVEYALVSFFSVGASAWYLPTVALQRSSGDTRVGANGDFAEFDLNAVARVQIPVNFYSLYLVGEGGLAAISPPSGADSAFDTPFLGLNYALGLGVVYATAPSLRIFFETRYQHLETSRTVSSDDSDLTQNLTGSRLLFTLGLILGG